MTSLFHLLNIGTLAAWLSVATFGTVGVLVPEWHPTPTPPKTEHPVLNLADITLGDEGADTATEEAAPASTPASPDLALPAPPTLPDLAQVQPLPEIPDLPTPTPAAKPTPKPAITTVRPAERKTTRPATSSTAARPTGGNSSGTNSGASTLNGKPGGTGSSTSTGMSDSARLAAGRMSKPSYPSEARRKNQTGTVTVAFTVGPDGKVLSAYAASSSSWPLLDAEAVRTVRRWTFPPGSTMKLQRPIVFRLN